MAPRKGLVQVFTGDGKGKTTAAAGLVLRALGHHFRVFVVVFMKGDYPYGEWATLAKLPGVKIVMFGLKDFCDPRNVKPAEKKEAQKAFNMGREAMLSGKYDLVVLDEVNVAVGWKLIELSDIIKLLDEKPENVELILTGRYADEEIIKRADLVTEMRKIKHPYDAGIAAREGIEY